MSAITDQSACVDASELCEVKLYSRHNGPILVQRAAANTPLITYSFEIFIIVIFENAYCTSYDGEYE